MSRTAQEASRIAPEVMAAYEPVIGLEVHAQLKTATKAFCGCSTRFGDAPNSNTCPVCLGLPGALPVLNKQRVELGIARFAGAELARCRKAPASRAKIIFIPTCPRATKFPCTSCRWRWRAGWKSSTTGKKKRIGITRLHLEDDAGKKSARRLSRLRPQKATSITTAAARRWPKSSPSPICARRPRPTPISTRSSRFLEYTEVSDCNMEEGSLRCDANVSVRRRGAREIRHQSGSEKSEFLPLPAEGAGIRNRAADRRARIRRSDRAGNAPVERRRRAAPSRCARRNSRTITAIFPIPICCRCAFTWR